MAESPGTVRAARLREAVLAYFGEQEPGRWVPFGDLVPLAPRGRVTVYTEADEHWFGFDDPRGPAYDAGPSGEPDTGMLADVLRGLHRDLLAEDRLAAAGGREWRLYTDDEPVGLKEIGSRLDVSEGTPAKWHHREVLPEPTWPAVSGRPAWAWHVIRSWALATGRGGLDREPEPFDLSWYTAMIAAVTGTVTVSGPRGDGQLRGDVWSSRPLRMPGNDVPRDLADQLLREGGWTRVTGWVAGSARVERITAAG